MFSFDSTNYWTGWFSRPPVRRSCWASFLDNWAATNACTSRYRRGRHFHYFRQRGSLFLQTPRGCCHVKQLKPPPRINSVSKLKITYQWLKKRATKGKMFYLTLKLALWACNHLSESAASSPWQSGTAKAPWTVDNLHSPGLPTHHNQDCNLRTHTS